MTRDDATVIVALSPTPGAAGAVALAEFVRDTVAAGAERRVLMFRPSCLGPARQREPQVGLLRSAWEGLRQTSRTNIFTLPRGGVVVIEPPPGHHLNDAARNISNMLEPQEADRALSLLRLPEQAAAVLSAVEESLGLLAAVRAAEPVGGRAGPTGDAVMAAERALASADVSSFLRRRKVCRLVPGGRAPEPLREDWRVSLRDVRDALMPGTELGLAPGLLRRLRRVLDRRLLVGLARAEELRGIGPLCLSLGLDAVTSPDFLRLDALWPASLRGQLTVALSTEDAVADPEGFVFARDLLVARGHRPMLDAACAPALLALAPSRVGIGLLRLRWSEAMPALDSPGAAALRAAFPPGPDAVVLSGVDRPAAIAWGWEMGITLFQGRLVESRRPPG